MNSIDMRNKYQLIFIEKSKEQEPSNDRDMVTNDITNATITTATVKKLHATAVKKALHNFHQL